MILPSPPLAFAVILTLSVVEGEDPEEIEVAPDVYPFQPKTPVAQCSPAFHIIPTEPRA